MNTRFSRSRLFWAFVVVSIISLLVWWLWFSEPARSPIAPAESTAPEVVMVTRGDLNAFVAATGRVMAERQARLGVMVSGVVSETLVEAGDQVDVGTPLLTLDPSALELRQQEAHAALNAAEARLAQAIAPASVGEISAAEGNLRAAQLALSIAEAALDEVPEEERANSEENVVVERARVSLTQARAALRRLIDGPTPEERALLDSQLAQAHIRFTQATTELEGIRLTAPFAGTIIEREVSAEERVSPSQFLFLLADLEHLAIAAEVDEVDVGRVMVGQPVTVTLDAFPTRPLVGEVRRIAPASDSQRGATTYRTIIDFTPYDLPLRLDMAADLQINTAQVIDTLLLPLNAIRYAESQPYVLVQRQDEFMPQDVVLGAQDGRMIEILSGLEEKEIIELP